MFESRKHFRFEMNNLCFGRGWRMARGHLVSLGACTAGWTNTRHGFEPKPGFVPIKDPAKALPDGTPMRFYQDSRNSLPKSKFASKIYYKTEEIHKSPESNNNFEKIGNSNDQKI